MATDDEAARKARARRLREEIDRRKSPAGPPGEGRAPAEDHEESAAEFVQRRMAELEEQKEDEAGG
jgi:hypothetical protein